MRTFLLFCILCVFWGIPYFFIKIALADVSPVCIAWSRLTLATLVLLPIAWRRGALRAARGHWVSITAFAITELAVPFSLIAFAEKSLSSAMTGVLIATVPLAVVLLAPLFGVREALSIRRLMGLIAGFFGVVVLLGFNAIAGADQWWAAVAIGIAILGYAVGPLIVQRYLAGVDEMGSVALSLAAASIVLLPFAASSLPKALPSARALESIAVLGLISTAGALLLYFHIIRTAGAARASIVAYVSPAIAAALGIAALHEPLSFSIAAGLTLILAGSALGSTRRVALPTEH